MPDRQWRILPAPPAGFSRTLGVPPLWANLLYNRGLRTPQELEPFLKAGPGLLLDPFGLPGMQVAVERLQRAIQHGETVGIFGDFDTDGVTATALLHQALTGYGLPLVPYIPHRVEEGHGLNSGALTALKGQGVSLLITVDCGVSSVAEVAQARSYGMDTIITDHHIPPAHLPPALAIVNPRVPGANYPFRDLTGVGLAFKLAQGLSQATGQAWDPSLLELAALGTVADLAPLQGENRYLVKEGIAQLQRTQRPGLRALYQQARLDPQRIDAEAIGFILSPRLNAAGRLDHAWTSLRLLVTDSEEEASGLAQELEGMNRQRQQLTSQYVEQAQRLVAGQEAQPLLLVESEEFTPGIVGLVASRLVEEYARPAVVVALAGDMARGSARSVEGFNIVAALDRCEALLERYGGHSQAAGFVVRRDRLPALRRQLLEAAQEVLAGTVLTPTLEIDAQVSPRALLGETQGFLRSLEPYGVGNPSPRFLTRHLEVLETRRVGKEGQHLQLKVREGGLVIGGAAAEHQKKLTWDAVAFQQAGRWQPGAQRVDLVYTVGEDTRWSAQGLRLTVLDFRCR